MAPLWGSGQFDPLSELPEEVVELLQEGWIVGSADALLLKSLYGTGWARHWGPDDVAHYECEINDVWVSPEGLPSDRESFLTGMVERTRNFAGRAILSARPHVACDSLTAVISIGVDDDYLTHGGTVKFFTRRGRRLAQYEELERYQLEAMAVILAEEVL